LTADDESFLAEIRGGFASVGELYGAVKLKAALLECVRRLSQRVNQYLNDQAPWKIIGAEPAQRAATVVYVALQAIDWLKLIWSPVLPHSSEAGAQLSRLRPAALWPPVHRRGGRRRGKHLVLRYDHSSASGRWEATTLPAGQAMREPAALFAKLDEAIMAEKLGT
jgi:methionyl-tRNA synthetase